MSINRDLANIISGGFTSADIPNLDASKITTGTFADARIAASNVSQHAQSFDDNEIVNDISTLALRQASNENKGAYNTNSMFVDVFQDSTGIDTTTNASRNASEYMETVTSATITPTAESAYAGSAIGTSDGTSLSINSSGHMEFGNTISTSGVGDATSVYGAIIDLGQNRTLTSPLKVVFREKQYADSGGQNLNAGFHQLNFSTGTSSGFIFGNTITPTLGTTSSLSGGDYVGAWQSWGTLSNIWDYSTLGQYKPTLYHADTNGAYSNIDTETLSLVWTSGTATGRYIHVTCNTTYGEFGQLTFTDGSGNLLTPFQGTTVNATGNFTGNTITAPSSVSSMGAIITYQDNAGTNALNTDIVLKLSADGGSNYSTATLVAMPDFSSGIKMAKVNDLAVTAGTSLKYKIEFANQASGSKEARIRGVSLQF